MIYFMVDGTIKVLSNEDLLIKPIKKLKYIHYLQRVTNKVTTEWSRMILSTIRRRILDGGRIYIGN